LIGPCAASHTSAWVSLCSVSFCSLSSFYGIAWTTAGVAYMGLVISCWQRLRRINVLAWSLGAIYQDKISQAIRFAGLAFMFKLELWFLINGGDPSRCRNTTTAGPAQRDESQMRRFFMRSRLESCTRSWRYRCTAIVVVRQINIVILMGCLMLGPWFGGTALMVIQSEILGSFRVGDCYLPAPDEHCHPGQPQDF